MMPFSARNIKIILGLFLVGLFLFSVQAASPDTPITPSGTGGTAASTTPANGLVYQNCLSEQRCREIDDVWQRIALVLGKPSDVVWVPLSGWMPFARVYQSFAAQISSLTTTTSAVSGACGAVSSAELSDIRGQPSISAKTINLILSEARSPAQGTGDLFIRYGKEYNIDSAFALAFFKVESQYGRSGVAVSTKGIGNIRYRTDALPDFKYDSSNGDFSGYNSWEQSIKGWFNYLAKSSNYLGGGKTTIEKIIPIYTGKSSNQPYIDAVKNLVQRYRQREQSCAGGAVTSTAPAASKTVCKSPSTKKSEDPGKSALTGVKFDHYGKLDETTSDCARSSPPDIIILHDGGEWGGRDCSNSKVVRDFVAFFQRRGLSSHYFICGNGDIYQLVSEDLAGIHAGCPKKFAGKKQNCPISYVNSRSIGIDIQNYKKHDSTNVYTDAQMDSLKKLLDNIQSQRNIPIDDTHVLAHFEVVKFHHNDPVKGFRWNLIGLDDHRQENGPKKLPARVTDADFPAASTTPSVSTEDGFRGETHTEESEEGVFKTIKFNSKDGNGGREVVIVTSTTFDPSKPSPVYFFFGGSGSNPEGIIKAVKGNIETLARQQPNFILVIPQIPSTGKGSWMDGKVGDYQELFGEILSQLKFSVDKASSVTFGAYSFGGAAVKNIVTSVPIPKPTKLVFIDACSANWCNDVKEKYLQPNPSTTMIVVQEDGGFGNYGLNGKALQELFKGGAVTVEIIKDTPHSGMFSKYFNKMYS